MDLGSSAQVYQQTKVALNHFREQRRSAEIHAAEFCLSNTAREQRQALLNIESFVRWSIRHEGARYTNNYWKGITPWKGLNDQLLSLTVSDRERETKIVAGIISTLEKAQHKLLARMSESEMLSCVEAMNTSEINTAGSVFKENLELVTTRLDDLLTIYEEKSKTTKDEVEQRVIAAECEKNKKLNKFEHATKQFVHKTLGWKIELDWEAHQKDLSNMKVAISEIRTTIEALEARIQVFEAMLLERAQRDKDLVNVTHILGIRGTSTTTQSTEDLESRVPPAGSTSPTSSQAGETDTRDHDPAMYSQSTASSSTETPKSQIKPQRHSTVDADILSSTTDAATEPVSMVRADSATGSTSTASQTLDHETVFENDNATHTKPPLHEIRHITPVSLSVRAKEYDHNKENVPSPLSTSSKKSFTLAFDGLDQYARGLFSSRLRSPSSAAFK